jgi:hypothetical protein
MFDHRDVLLALLDSNQQEHTLKDLVKRRKQQVLLRFVAEDGDGVVEGQLGGSYGQALCGGRSIGVEMYCILL